MIGKKSADAFAERRQEAIDSFDAFCWAQRNRVRNKLNRPTHHELARKDDNSGLVKSAIVDTHDGIEIERRK